MGKSNDKKKSQEEEVALSGEFGGTLGNLFFIGFSHFIVYYLWFCVQFNNASPLPPTLSVDGVKEYFADFIGHIINDAAPTWHAFTIYITFMAFQTFLAVTMPGFEAYGLPVPTENNRRLKYKCNGVVSWYITLVVFALTEYFGYFRLSSIVSYKQDGKDVFVLGSLMTVSIILADITSVVAYFSAVWSGNAIRMTGNFVQDFFMGAWLNPRIGNFDIKFFAETRFPWIGLFTLTLAAAMKQYEEYGTISFSMCFILLAHGLYTNAVMKGEELIPLTWDIFYEKWGFMLIYWNLAGVPFVYSTTSFYIQKTGLISLPLWYKVALLVSFLFAYWVWDTANSQKTRFRVQMKNTFVPRYTFPQLPWGTLKMPIKHIQTKAGSPLLIDGWYKYARKINYASDNFMALCWGLCTGCGSVLPYFYWAFFFGMMIHRWIRDDHRCSLKYGEDWEKYKKIVPYVFIPYVF